MMEEESVRSPAPLDSQLSCSYSADTETGSDCSSMIQMRVASSACVVRNEVRNLFTHLCARRAQITPKDEEEGKNEGCECKKKEGGRNS